MKVSPVLIVGFKFEHHGSYSGYHQLSKYLDNVYYLNRDNYDYSSRFFDYPGLSLINSFLYRIRNILFFLKLRRLCYDSSYRVIHFLYPENTLAFCSFEIPSDKIVIATFHQPVSYFNNLLCGGVTDFQTLKNFRRCNKVILLSASMQDEFKSITKIKEVYCIPHGVDVVRFSPSVMPRRKKSILFVGNWLRDFSCASQVFLYLSTLDPEIEFTIVTNEENHFYFSKVPNAHLMSDISDSDLLELFQTVTLLFLPLLGATANNALLEAACCGLPIFVTHSDATAEYFPIGTCKFFPLQKHTDIPWLAQSIQSLLNSNGTLDALGISGRLNAEFFSWENIAKRTKQLYS